MLNITKKMTKKECNFTKNNLHKIGYYNIGNIFERNKIKWLQSK
jgi:hypothetical protein